MVAFRKWSPALAVFAFMAIPAVAQTTAGTPLACFANSGVPPVVRAEGYTELVGDLVVTCQGGNPGAPFLANFQLFLNTNITSRLVGSDLSEALLMIDEPGLARLDVNGVVNAAGTPFCVSPAFGSNSAGGPGGGAAPACNPVVAGQTYQQGTYTVFRATRGNQSGAANENLLVWAGVPVQPPGSNRERTFRITNVRANANGLGASQTLIPTQILAYLSVFPSGTLPIDNPQQTVGYVQQGLLFDTRNCGNTGGLSTSGTSFLQCTSTSAQRDFFADPLRSGSLPAIGGLRYREGFQTAFKVQIAPGQDASIPGVVYNTESGFVRGAAVPGNELGIAGVADSGTRLAARFTGVPNGVKLFVSARNAPASSTVGTNAVLVITDAAGSSNIGAPSPSRTAPTEPTSQGKITCGVDSLNMLEVPIVNGAGQAVWEVTAANQSVSEEFTFLYSVGYRHNPNAGLPGIGEARVIGNLAPYYAQSDAVMRMATTILPIPRFVARTDSNRAFSFAPCVTNLLFPYVTNWAGFDTGLAIANTSQDPFGSASDRAERLQNGRVRLNYYGRLANGNPPSLLTEQTDREVAGGETITMVLSSGGGLGLKGNPGFQGYIIAQCDFLYAHGFAFITDGPIGQARVAEGYLAIVLDAAGVNRTGQTGEAQAH